MKPNIRRLTETGAEFEDGSFVENLDTIIYATGYKTQFPFICDDFLKVKYTMYTVKNYD